MSMSSHLLLLLILVFSLCGATEYYVTPTEPTNASCPAQPCLTLSQYINDSDHYFQSNTVFKFLPGTHRMDRPLHIEAVQNLSLESLDYTNQYPHVLVQFACKGDELLLDTLHDEHIEVECAAVQLCHVHNVSFQGISFVVQTPNVSGITLQYASNIYIDLSIVCSVMPSPFLPNTRIGILIFKAKTVEVHSSHASNCSCGFVLHKTNSIRIINTTAIYHEDIHHEGSSDSIGGTGISLLSTTNAVIVDTSTIHNARNGMLLKDTANIAIFNTTVAHNGHQGIHLWNNTRIRIVSTTVMHNLHNGISLSLSHEINIKNTVVMHNSHNGMYLFHTTRVRMCNTTIAHNGKDGLLLWSTTKITMVNTTVAYNGNNGIHMLSFDTTRTSIINTIVMYNEKNGMHLHGSKKVSIIDTTLLHSGKYGMHVENTTKISIINTTAMYSHNHGKYMENTTTINIINSTGMHNGDDGMYLLNTRRVGAINTTLMHNGYSGLHLVHTTTTSVIKATVKHNLDAGIFSYQTTDTIVTKNAVTGNGNSGVFLYHTKAFHIINTSLMQNGWTREVTTSNGEALNTADLVSLPATVVVFDSSLHIRGCNVTRNSVSAIKLFASNVTASDDVIISNNKAVAGSAFLVLQKSILKLAKTAHIQIMNNHAINTGGAFYITNDLYYNMLPGILHDTILLKSSCFINADVKVSQRMFTFLNNSAGRGGDILYGGHVLYALDGAWNCLETFKSISKVPQGGLSLISSEPLRVCLCNESALPDCMVLVHPTLHTIYPGQSINISVVAVGQSFGTVAGSVHAQFLQITRKSSPRLEEGQMIQGATQEKCNHLNYTIFSPGDMSEVALVLTTESRVVSEFVTSYEDSIQSDGRHVDLSEYYRWENQSSVNMYKYSRSPVYVNISFLPCPIGFMLTTNPPFRCDCIQLLQELQGVKCYIQDQVISRSGPVWVGILKDDNETVAASKYCLFDYCNGEDNNVTLSDPDSQCNYNHSGTLCGGCQPGLSLALGSAQCLPCSNQYLAFLIPFALAGPAGVFSIKLLHLTTPEGAIYGLIFYANIVKANEYILLPQGQTNPLTIFVAWLNLDLGMETCFFNGLTAYTKTWLQFVFPLYIWSIAGLIIVLVKYSDKVAKVMGNNSVPALATLFLLSYAKLFRTIITILSYTMLYSSQGHKAVWSADGNVVYLGPKHAPLFAVAVAALLFLWFPYTLLLLLGQWLHRCNCRQIDHILIKAKPFLDIHYGPLKRNCCYWFGVLLFVRATILLVSALTPTNYAINITFCIAVSAPILAYFALSVYNNVVVAMSDISFFINLSLLCTISLFITRSGENHETATYTMIGMAIVQFLGLIVFKWFSILKKSEKVMACFHRGQPAEDDWELYEQAALQREMESDHEEEEDSDGSGSTDSLVTY